MRSEAEPPLYEDRLVIMIDDGSVPMFAEQGSWITCHRGMRDMPDMATKDQVKAHSLLGGGDLKKSDVRKFLPASRGDDIASWDKTKSADAIAKLKAAESGPDSPSTAISAALPVAASGHPGNLRCIDLDQWHWAQFVAAFFMEECQPRNVAFFFCRTRELTANQ